MNDLGKVEIIRSALLQIELPKLRRPLDRPTAATNLLANWCVTVYAYSSISHFRQVLSGLVRLLDDNNEATAFLACRHLYEWAMHASFMLEKCRDLYIKQNWKEIYEVFEQADTGNSWIKNHGNKYAPELPLEEMPSQVRLKHFVSAYERFQKELYGRDGDEVRDTYGLLSEHSHPNGACFLAYRKIVGDTFIFGEADATALPHPLPYTLDWIVCIKALLSLTKETTIKNSLDDVLKSVLNPSDVSL